MRRVSQYRTAARGRRIIALASASTMALAFFATAFGTNASYAAGPNDSFALQLTPSPLVETVKPGVASTYPLQIRNNGTGSEDLKIEVRRFDFNSTTGQVDIADTADANYSQWVSFSAAKFSVAPGQVYTQNVGIHFPADAGFSYSFVIVISRQSQPQVTGGGRLLAGTIADFGLINIDKPGATKELSITSLKTSAGIYEYVPATLSLTFKNSGNTFVEPSGNIFIGRTATSNPIDTLSVNDAGGYILPQTSRTISAQWNDGFPKIQSQTLSDGTVKNTEVWNWADISKFRIGEYTAHVVAVYNNGSYDVPLNAIATFWILPWKILLGAFILVLIIAFGIFAFIRSIVKGVNRAPRFGRRR